MEKPERKGAAQESSVESCDATECVHNDDRSCTAGEIQVKMQDGRPVCGTYSSEKPKARP